MNSKKSEFKDAWVEAMKEPKNEAIAEFLRQLPEDEIYGLVKTTSGGVVAAENIDEAITVIIMFSDAVSLLNRRRVKKDYLMAYLASKNVKFSFQSDKSKLCNLVLKIWGEAKEKKLKFDGETKKLQISSTSASQSSSQTQGPTTRAAVKAELKYVPVQTQTTPEKPKTKTEPTSPSSVPVNNNCQVINPFYSVRHSASETVEDEEMSEDDDDDTASASPSGSPIKQSAQAERETGQLLAGQFAEWFYTRLNSLEDFTPAHFWKDCNFSMQIESISNPRSITIVRDGDTVCLAMRSLVAEEGCFFNPNILNGIGVRGKVNPHGLAQVMVCGTVHRGAASVGTFEQNFGLMKDPSMNNSFRIKFSLLRLRERDSLMSGSENTPGPDTTMCGIIEEIDD